MSGRISSAIPALMLGKPGRVIPAAGTRPGTFVRIAVTSMGSRLRGSDDRNFLRTFVMDGPGTSGGDVFPARGIAGTGAAIDSAHMAGLVPASSEDSPDAH